MLDWSQIIILVLVIIIILYYVLIIKNKKIETFESPTPSQPPKLSNPNILPESLIYMQTTNITPMMKQNLRIDPSSSNINPDTKKEYTRILVPTHLVTTLDSKYLAVFNDGQLYMKSDIVDDTLWMGPLDNSLYYPPGTKIGIGMRMVMFFPLIKNQEREVRLLGIGADNLVYYKENEKLTSQWKRAPTRNPLVYLFCDFYEQNNKYPLLYGITTSGLIVYKNDNGKPPSDIIEEDEFMALPFTPKSPVILNNIPLLKVYWDRNGFMIGIGTDFKLYQKNGIDWTVRPWEISKEIRGTNPGSSATVIDMLMDKDSRMIGLVLNNDPVKPMISIQKQKDPYYLSDFESLQDSIQSNKKYNTYDIMKYKTGFDWQLFFSFEDADEHIYRQNNLQAIYQRQLLEDKAKLKKICRDRKPATNTEMRNYDLEKEIATKDEKINTLNKELEGLLTFGSVGMKKTFDTTTFTPTPSPKGLADF
jgi:hypothetical protein